MLRNRTPWLAALALTATTSCSLFQTLGPGHDAGATDARDIVHVPFPTDASEVLPDVTTSSQSMGSVSSTYAAGAIDAARMAYTRGDAWIDLNGDGVTEWNVQRSAAGDVLYETMDMNGDGEPDMIWDYRADPHTFSVDDDYDGVFEFVRETSPSPIAAGAITVFETRDDNRDGVSDHRQYYVVLPTDTSVVVTDEYLVDGAFSDSTASQSTIPVIQPSTPVNVTTTGPTACNPDQAMRIQQAASDAIDQGVGCLAALDPHLAGQAARLSSAFTFTFECQSMDSGACAWSDLRNTVQHWYGRTQGRVEVYPAAGDPSRCGDFTSTVFHELMHFALGPHEGGDGTMDPGDRVYGCEQTCFGGMGTSQTCAACLGTRNGDSRCHNYPMVPCPIAPVPARCACGFRISPSQDSCQIGCSDCYDPECTQRGPCRNIP